MEYDIEQETDVLFCRIFFHYLGSLQMPHTWKQGPSLSCINTCIKRIESEGREPISVSLEIHNNSLRLVNNVGNTIRVFPFKTLVYTGASTANIECMVVVTRSSISEYSPQVYGGGKMINISHAFRVQPNESIVKYYGPAKAQKLMRNLDVLEYPQDALRVLKTFVRIFELCTKYEPQLKRPKSHFDNATGRVVLIDFRNNMSDVQSCASSEHSPFVVLSNQHSSSDGSITDNASYTTSDHSHRFDNPYENITTSYSDTKLNGKVASKSSTSLDCISKHSTFAPKSGSHSSLHESSIYGYSPSRKSGFKPQRKVFCESEPCLGKNLTHVEKWLESLDNLLSDPDGVELFRKFLKTEFSAENLEFWLAVEKYKSLKTPIEIGLQKSAIFQRFIHENAPSQVNLEERLRREIIANLKLPDISIFNQAQRKTYHILRYDCYPRFKSCTILADYIQENRLASMKGSLPPDDDVSSQKLKLSHSDIQFPRQSNDSEKTHKHNPLSFLRRSFAKRRNSSSKDNTPPLSAQSSSDEFTFIREVPTDEDSVYIHIPGREKLSCKVNSSLTLRAALHPLFQSLHISHDLFEYRQADTLNLIKLDQNSVLFSGKNIILQQHTESFALTVKLPSHPVQEFILRTSNDKTILDTIQPILDLKNISKDLISLQLTDCEVPLQLELGSSVLNKQKVELTRFEFDPLKVKTSVSSNSLNSSPSREAKQELLKTQYPNRKVNKLRNSQRTKKEKPTKTNDMLSLLESAQMNRMNDQRSTLERNSSNPFLSEKPPKMPAISQTDRTGADICPHTGETLFQAPNEKQPPNKSPLNPRKEYVVLDPPKFTPHKPTIKVPQNLESKFQPTYFAPNPRLKSHKYNVAPGMHHQLGDNIHEHKQMYNPAIQQPNSVQTSLPVTSVHTANLPHQTIFYKGVQHLSSQNPGRKYGEQSTRTQYYTPDQVSHSIQPTPSPFDECNLPSRMKFSQNPLPNFQAQNVASGSYKPSFTKPDQRFTHTYTKPLHTPSYL